MLDSLGYERKDLSEESLEGDWKNVVKDLGTSFTDNFEDDVYLMDHDDALYGRSFFSRMQMAHDRAAEENFVLDEDGENPHWHEDTRDDLVSAFETFANREGLTLPT